MRRLYASHSPSNLNGKAFILLKDVMRIFVRNSVMMELGLARIIYPGFLNAFTEPTEVGAGMLGVPDWAWQFASILLKHTVSRCM